MTNRWSTPADVRDRVRRRWNDGTLLRCYAAGEPFPTIDVPLRGPRPSEIGDDLSAVQRWIGDLEAGGRRGGRYDIVYAAVGGRSIGRNQIPARAILSSYPQAWALLDCGGDVRRFDDIIRCVTAEPGVRDWVTAQPIKALGIDAPWPVLLSAYRWLDDHRGSGRYLRQIDAAGVDTKFVEAHRGVLAEWLGVPSHSGGFLHGLGLATKPEMLRLRADPGLFGALPFTDITAPVDELRTLAVSPRMAVIVENEITFLSIPLPSGGIVLWGKGFEVDRAGSLPWLQRADVHYWGDLDTHGFAILNRLRSWLPQARSFLMDRETLLAHRQRWVREGTPTRARLDRLTPSESGVYDDLVTDRLGERIRLEQERIDWAWAMARLPPGVSASELRRD